MTTNVIRSKDCGNSPKNRLVEDFTVALAIGDSKGVSRLVTDDVEWVIAGGRKMVGVAEVTRAVDDARPARPYSVTIDHVMSHGKLGAASGSVQSGDEAYLFCNVIEFSNARATAVRRITTYRVQRADR